MLTLFRQTVCHRLARLCTLAGPMPRLNSHFSLQHRCCPTTAWLQQQPMPRRAQRPPGLLSIQIAIRGDLLDLCKLPLSVAQRAHGSRLQPTRDAIEVEDVAAAAPRDAVPGIIRQPRVCASHARVCTAASAGGEGRLEAADGGASGQQARTGLRLDGRLVELVAADGARVCQRRAQNGVSAIIHTTDGGWLTKAQVAGTHQCRCPTTRMSRHS